MDIKELWRRAIQCGLVPSEAPAQIEQAFRGVVGRADGAPITATEISDFLVQHGRWSEYQRSALLAEPAGLLRYGNHLIVAIETESPFSKWIRVDGGYLIRAAAGNSTLVRHAAVSHPALLDIECHEVDGDVAVLAAISEISASSIEPNWDRATILRSAGQAAAALQSLHEAELSHGSLCEHRFRDVDDGLVLLRDPSGAGDGDAGFLDPIDERQRWLHRDPHLPRPSTDPKLSISPSSTDRDPDVQLASAMAADVYSLGCVLFRWSHGRDAFAGGDENDIRSRHRDSFPAELTEAVQKGADGDPLDRIIAHSLAKDPSSRLTAKSLCQAIAAVQSGPPGEASSSKPPVRSASKSTATSPPATKTVVVAAAEKDLSRQDSADPPVHAEATDSSSPASPTSPPTTTPVPVVHTRRRRNPLAPVVLGIMAAIVGGQTIYLIVVPVKARVVERRSDPRPYARPTSTMDRGVDPSDGFAPLRKDTATDDGAFRIVDDPALLYVPPNRIAAGEPLNLSWLPAGPSLLASIRPSRMFNDANRPALANVLGQPDLQTFRDVTDQSGLPPNQIDTLVAAFYSSGGKVQAIYHAMLSDELAEPPATWQRDDAAPPGTVGIERYQLIGDESVQIAKLSGSEVLFGPQALLNSAVARDGAAATLPPATDRIWRLMPGDADIIVLGGPNFFFADRRQWLADVIPEWQDSLRGFFVPDVAAIGIGVQWVDGQTYVETRLMPAGLETPVQLMQRTQRAIGEWPQVAQRQSDRASDETPWSRLVDAYPKMVRFAKEQIRLGIADATVTANLYLPSTAAGQLAVAAVLTANTPEKVLVAVDAPRVPQTVDEFLAVPMTVAIAQESLKAALSTIRSQLVDSLPSEAKVPPFTIIGGDLQIDGITQNQQIRDFNFAELPMADVLTQLCLAANPDKTAKTAADEKQKLVWVVDDGQILITTRAAAADKKYTLPEAFEPTP